jgi:hypothetical protein
MEERFVDDTSAVIGVFDSTDEAERALLELGQIGFGDDRVKFAMSEALTIIGSYSAGGEPVHSAHEAAEAVIRVQAEDRQQEVVDLLHRYGAFDVRIAGGEEPVFISPGNFRDVGSPGNRIAAEGSTGSRYDAARGSESWEDVQTYYRSRWQQRYGAAGRRWEDYEPAYRYGWERAKEEDYRGRPWSAVEPEFRSDWEQRHHTSPWDRVAGAVRDVWESITADLDHRDLDRAA